MNTIEGTVIDEQPNGMHPTLTIERDDGIRYWGTWPVRLWGGPSLLGERVRIRANKIVGDVEWKQPRYAEVVTPEQDPQ